MKHWKSKACYFFIAILLLTFSNLFIVSAKESGTSIGTWKEVSPIPYKPSIKDESLSVSNIALAGDNKILVTVNWDDAYVYDMSKDKWKQIRNRTMEYGQAAVTLADGRVFIIGGKEIKPASQDSSEYESVKTEIFNPANNSFTSAAPLPESFDQASAVLLKDGNVLLFGKTYKNERVTYLYDVLNNRWNRKENVAYTGTSTLINNKGNVFSYSPNALENSLAPGEYYAYSRDEFFTSWVMPNQRTAGACTVLADDKFFIVGGARGGESTSANLDADIFDPELNMWRTTSAMSSGRVNAKAVTLPDGQVIVIAGVHGKDFFKTTEVYNPITDTWVKGPSLKYTYSIPSVIQLKNGNIMIVGGYDGKNSNRCEMLVLNSALKNKSIKSYEKIENSVLTTVGSPYIKVNGNKILLDDSNSAVKPFLKNGQTMVPINFFKKGLGAEIYENKANGKVTISFGNKTVVPTQVEKVNGITYVPIKPVAESLGKKVTWLKGLIAVADKTVYMDVISAHSELTELNSSHLLGIADNAKIVKKESAFSKDGWDYKWYYIRHENADAYFKTDDGNGEYSNLYLIRENKSQNRLEQVYEGVSGKIIKRENDIIYFYDYGYLSKIKPGDRYKAFVKNTESLSGSQNMSMTWYPFEWEAGNYIPLSNAIIDGEWIYFVWDPYDYLDKRREDPLGYPMRVKYDGSGLQILSQHKLVPNWRGMIGFTQAGDYLYYITSRILLAGREEQFTLHGVKKDGSFEKDIAEVMRFEIYKDMIYYQSLDATGDYSSAKFYSINPDGSGKKLLSSNGAWEVKFYGDNLYFRIYGDADGLYTMKTDGSGRRKIGDVQGDLLYADDKYVYYDYNYFDWNDKGGKFKNMGKYRINIMTGKKEKAK